MCYLVLRVIPLHLDLQRLPQVLVRLAYPILLQKRATHVVQSQCLEPVNRSEKRAAFGYGPPFIELLWVLDQCQGEQLLQELGHLLALSQESQRQVEGALSCILHGEGSSVGRLNQLSSFGELGGRELLAL